MTTVLQLYHVQQLYSTAVLLHRRTSLGAVLECRVPKFTQPHVCAPPGHSLVWSLSGADLYPEDVREFHTFYKALCERHAQGLYAPLKEQCDKYFYLPARKEHRGVGGIFFDDLSSLPLPLPGAASGASNPDTVAAGLEGEGSPGALDAAYRFTRDVGEGFMASYWPIVERRRGVEFGEQERQWQLVRRGRYLEFNLLYDRGVRFGMDGNGRTASIMVSGE